MRDKICAKKPNAPREEAFTPPEVLREFHSLAEYRREHMDFHMPYAEETRLLLEHLTVNPLHFTSDHASNYLPLKGGLPGDRDRLLALVDGALAGERELLSGYGRGL